jgi:hypothetical protein
MPRLYLHQLTLHPYDNSIVCAYIYYGIKNKPRDHLGNKIEIFMENHLPLFNHLNEHVLSRLNMCLTDTKYKVKELDFVNMAPHPFFVIEHKEGLKLRSSDLATIKKEIIKALNKLNISVNKPGLYQVKSISETSEAKSKSSFKP